MGGGGSQTINQAFDMSAINQSIYNQITKNKSESLASQAQIQTMRVVMKNVRGCTTNLSQTINASASSSSQLENQQTTEIKNAITNEMQAAVGAQIEKATEAGNMQFGDKQNVNQEVTLEIKNIIENTITTENINSAIAEQVSIQQGDLIIDGYDCRESGEINFTQDVTAQIAAAVVTKNLTDAIASSEVLNQLSAAADAAQKSENKGIADIVGTLFDGLTGPAKYAIVASVVCCCLLVVIMLVLGMSPAGQKAMNKGVNAGLARLRK